MMRSGPSPASARAPHRWVWALPALTGLLAAIARLNDWNTDWFVAWNGAAQVLPAAVWAGVTNLGSTGGAFAVVTATLVWQPRWAAAALLAAPAGTLFTHGFKRLFSEARPAAVLDPEQITIIGTALKANAFPSGHSVTAFALAAVIALCSLHAGRRRLAWLALAVATVTAFSRVAVGAHWPLDILVGAAGGWLCGALGVWWSARWRFWEAPNGVRIMSALLGASALWLFFENLGYPEGRWMQYALASLGVAGAVAAFIRSNGRPH
ncbi:phosphatase PAP2 family protein [Rhodocyclaceae bacterium SMB388]